MNKLFWIGFQHEKRVCERIRNALRDVYALIGSSEAEYVRDRYIQLLERCEQREADEPREETSEFRLPLSAVIKMQKEAPIDTFFWIPEEAIKLYKAERIERIRAWIQKGLTLPHSIFREYPRDLFREDYKGLPRRVKSYHSAVSYQTVKIDESMIQNYGVTVCRQDGKQPSIIHLTEIRDGLEELFLAVDDLSDLCRATNLTIAHTNGKRVFNSPLTCGMYRPIYQAITLGVQGTRDHSRMETLAHELAGHWLDVVSTPLQRWVNRLMGKESAFPRQILFHSFLDAWVAKERTAFPILLEQMIPFPKKLTDDEPGLFTPSEIWGRVVEQFVADRLLRRGIRYPICAKPLNWYYDRPGYWSQGSWKNEIRNLVQRGFQARLWMARRVNGLSESRIRKPPKSYLSVFPWVDTIDLEFFGHYRAEKYLPRDLLEE